MNSSTNAAQETNDGTGLESFQLNNTMIRWKEEPSRRAQSGTTTLGPLVVQTTFDGSSGNSGIMFDISSPPGGQDVQIISMDINVAAKDPSCRIEIYGRKGTHVGFETMPFAWTLIVNTTIQSQGFGDKSHIPPTAFLQPPHLSGNATYAFYMYLPNAELRYDLGTALGDVVASDQYLAIHSGTGVGGTFNQTYPGRVWNGAITFNVTKPKSEGLPDPPTNNASQICAMNLTTSYINDIGSYGQMFNFETFNNMIEVTGVDFQTDLLLPVTYELYTRIGTFVNGVTLKEWVLLQSGTINGNGAGRGTPIRGFAPFVVYPNSVQGFYVTLTTPNLRYALLKNSGPTDLKVGDLYISNDDASIQLGASVGTYPLGSTFFGPRLFSGAILYNLYEACPTSAPSASPSQIASNAPSAISTLAPTPSGSYVGACTTESSLETRLDGTTSAYGTMFTVVAKNESLTVTSIELLIRSTSMVEVSVYSKPGDYKGFESTPRAWKQVAKTKVQASGSALGTVVPTQSFEPVTIYPGRTHAFYATISTPDLLYSTPAAAVNTEVATNDYLSINAGAGLIDKSFGSNLYEPRVFNGALIFVHSTDCFSQSVISFGFNVQYNPILTQAKVFDLISSTVGTTVQSLVNTETDLELYKSQNELTYNSTNTFAVTRPGGNVLCPNLNAGWHCIPVDANVTLSHRISLDAGQLNVHLLNYASNVTSALNSDESKMLVTYAGSVATAATLRISLLGSLTAPMGESEQEYFKAVTMDYIQKKLSGQANVLGVQIVDQKLNKGTGGSHGRFLQSSSSSLDITTTVTGEYTPPPDVQVGTSSSNAINANNGGSYTQDLQDSSRQKPEWLQNKAYFDKVTGASSQVLSPNPTAASASQSGGGGGLSSGGLIGIIVVVAVLFLASVYYFCFCRKGSKKSERDNDGMPIPVNSSILTYDEKIMDADCFYKDSHHFDNDTQDTSMGYSNNYDSKYPRKANKKKGSPMNVSIRNDDPYALT